MNNILFVMSDQFRADALGLMNRFPVKTPNLDRLAGEGTRFNNAYCANPVCCPARASLMTGCYSYDHGVYYNDQNFPRSMETLPGMLAENGYYTVHIGKKHIHPERRAIGFHKLVLKQKAAPFGRRQGGANTASVGSWHAVDALNRGYPVEPSTQPLEAFEPVVCVETAMHELDWIRERRDCTATGSEPFFMKVSLSKPHNPCNPPEPYFSMYAPEDLPPPVATDDEISRFSPQLKQWYDIWKQMDPDRLLRHRAQYFGTVTLVDAQIGRLIAKLEQLGIRENTLIVFTADHGDALCDHHLQQKAFFYDPMVRVPFIFAGPGIPDGQVVEENVSHIDLFPTVADFCGLRMPMRRNSTGTLIYPDCEEGDARTLAPYFLNPGQPVEPNRIVIAENAMFGQRLMLKQGTTKVNTYVEANAHLRFDRYDLAADPDELDNQGVGMDSDDLTPELRQGLAQVLDKQAGHRDRHYYFQGKVRPFFT